MFLIEKVYTRLQKLMLCLSWQRVLKYLDRIGEKYNEEVIRWRKNVEANRFSMRVSE